MLELRPTAFDHPDAVKLIDQLQGVYRERYGDGDDTPTAPAEFAPPHGHFVIGYLDDVPVACGGWRVAGLEDGILRPGDAEVKRMYVLADQRGRGFARAVLAELERSAAAAGRIRVVLETGLSQPEAIALYLSSGYSPIPNFGLYRDEPSSRCFAKELAPNSLD